MQLTLSTEIEASPAQVFARMTDVASWPDTFSGINKVDILTDGPMAVGTVFCETRMIHGREGTEKMTVTEFTPPTRFVVTAENHGTQYRVEHGLEDLGKSTRLNIMFSGKPVKLWACLLAPIGLLMRGSVRKMMESDLADLKAAAERKT